MVSKHKEIREEIVVLTAAMDWWLMTKDILLLLFISYSLTLLCRRNFSVILIPRHEYFIQVLFPPLTTCVVPCLATETRLVQIVQTVHFSYNLCVDFFVPWPTESTQV